MKKSILTGIAISAIFICLNCFGKGISIQRYNMDNIQDLHSILEKVSSTSLVIFDVDEVLVYPTNIVQLQIASPFWEASMADIEKRLGKDNRDLLHSIMLLQSHWKLTDHMLPQIIQDLQTKNIQVLALTSFRRGKMGKIQSVEDWRNAQLKQHNIDFSITASLSRNYFEINQLKHSNVKKPVYKDGIIYTDLHSKSDTLGSFLEQTNLKPKEIIFIDDKLFNIQDLENYCKSANINFIGIHDNRIIKKYNNFDKNLGKYQFHYLEHHHVWLDDEAAKQKMIDPQADTFKMVGEKSNS